MTINELMNFSAISSSKTISLTKIHRVLMEDYNKFVRRYGKIIGSDSDGESSTFVVQIPSESFKEKLMYDVVIKIYNNGLKEIKGNMEVKVITNSPSFMFTHGYVYNKAGLLIDDLKEIIGKRALTEPPNVRNPRRLLGMDKSIFYAILLLQENKNKLFNTNYPNFNNKSLKTTIHILNEYNSQKKSNPSLEAKPKQFSF
jgi:hypothetical protein